MKYTKLHWRHNSPDNPIVIFSELDEEFWEVRKVEFFREGPPRVASELTRPTFLSDQPFTSLEVSTPALTSVEITREEFETAWEAAHK